MLLSYWKYLLDIFYTKKIYKRLNTIYNALVWNNYEYDSYKDWELSID